MLLGVMVAALICLTVGLIIFITAKNQIILETAQNYTQLLQDKAIKMFIGTAMIIIGAVGFSIPSIILTVLTVKSLFDDGKKEN